MNNIFLDINIIIDLLDTTRKSSEASRKMLKIISNKDIKIIISEDMFSTIFYIVKDKKSVLNFLIQILSEWKIVAFGNDVIEKSLDYCIKNGGDLEDVMQCFCAKKYDCNYLVTNDKNFCKCGVAHITPEEFLKLKLID